MLLNEELFLGEDKILKALQIDENGNDAYKIKSNAETVFIDTSMLIKKKKGPREERTNQI